VRESLGGKPEGAMKVKACFWCDWVGWLSVRRLARTTGPSRFGGRKAFDGAAQERTRWDPKDGELCLSRTKPEETLVEVRSGSDVQIDRQTWI
jgi:hypothetical protein